MYVSLQKLKNKLPTGVPERFEAVHPDLEEADLITAWDLELMGTIEDSSSEVDELIGDKFPLVFESNSQRFPELPQTPITIQKICLFLSIYNALNWFGMGLGYESDEEISYKELAEEMIDKVKNGSIVLSDMPKQVVGGGYSDRERVMTETEVISF
jgi:hypothetical protein